ncbi:MAG: hypothetical protein ACOH18_03115 [Candidatus Saccharimonadaceae bacterium]
MRLVIKGIFIGVTLGLAVTLIVSPQLFAHNGVNHENGEVHTESEIETETASQTKSGELKDAETTKPDPKVRQEIAKAKLDDKKKAVCENRQATINTRFTNVTSRSQNQYDRIDTIVTKTEKFYTEKGLSVANYDQLATKVAQAKATAQDSLEALKATPKFSCDSDGPKADVQAFLNLRLTKATDFQAYREAVKALIEAVKTAAKAAETAKEAN